MKRAILFLMLLASLALALTPPALAEAPHPAPAPRPALVIPQRAGTHRLSCTLTVEGTTLKLPFVLYLPESYQPGVGKFPVLVFLHGSGENGTDLDAIFLHGPNFELERKDNKEFRKGFPMIVISPQCPPRGQRWDNSNMVLFVNALLDEVLPKLNADTDRLYATGLSMGGIGTWYLTSATPGRFAAAVPISAVELDPSSRASKLKDTSILAIAGVGDQSQIAGSMHMAAAINQAGGFAQTVVGPGGHAVWIPAYALPRTYEWLLLNSKGKPRPSVDAKAETFPSTPGFHHLAFASSAEPGHSLDYVLYLPVGYKPGNAPPMLIHLPDSRHFGTFKNGLVLHGPAMQAADAKASRQFPFILVQPMLPPFAATADDGSNETLSKLLQQLIAQYHPDPQRIYIAGSGDGARLALATSAQADACFAVTILDVPAGYPDLNNLSATGAPANAILAVTNSSDGDIYRNLKSLVDKFPEGSEMTVLSKPQFDRSCFSIPDVYAKLLKIKRKTTTSH